MTVSLYLRLGGAQGVADLVDEIVDRHAANPILGPHLHSKDLAQLKALCLPFFSVKSDGSSRPESLSELLAVLGMKLGNQELAEAAGDVMSAMRERGLADAEVREVMQRLGLTNDCTHAGND